MSTTKITSEVLLVSEILFSGRFIVPWHQRGYDWSVEQVGELLTDIMDALETGKTCYFLGSIMLVKPNGARRQQINDGQQRLITLSMLVAALCRHFGRRRSRDQARETLALRALFDRPSHQTSRLKGASRYEPRIEPPKKDHSNYVQILRGHDIGTNGLLTAAWNVIVIFVGGMSRKVRKEFFDFVMEKLEVSVLDVPKDVDANSVFEALNARGKTLDDVDLIRNRLYSYFSETKDAARRETVHGNLEATTVILRSSRTVQEYFRCYLQCRYGYLQKTRFYREVRRRIEAASSLGIPSDYVFGLVAGLGRNDGIELFRTIMSPSTSESLDRLPVASGQRDMKVLLGELREYKVSHPLVFALLHRFIFEIDKEKKRKAGRVATRSLRNLASFVMRTAFVAPKFESSRFEAAFANCAQNVFEGEDLLSLDILSELERNDEWEAMSDPNFIRHMAEMELKETRKARRYLFGINARIQRGADALREDRCSVEHILPQSEAHWRGWTGFKGENLKDWVHRTGNLVLVSVRENRSGPEFNRNFTAKKRAFKDSVLQMPRDVAVTYDEWTPQSIEKRSQWLAKEAAAAWTFVRPKST